MLKGNGRRSVSKGATRNSAESNPPDSGMWKTHPKQTRDKPRGAPKAARCDVQRKGGYLEVVVGQQCTIGFVCRSRYGFCGSCGARDSATLQVFNARVILDGAACQLGRAWRCTVLDVPWLFELEVTILNGLCCLFEHGRKKSVCLFVLRGRFATSAYARQFLHHCRRPKRRRDCALCLYCTVLLEFKLKQKLPFHLSTDRQIWQRVDIVGNLSIHEILN